MITGTLTRTGSAVVDTRTASDGGDAANCRVTTPPRPAHNRLPDACAEQMLLSSGSVAHRGYDTKSPATRITVNWLTYLDIAIRYRGHTIRV